MKMMNDDEILEHIRINENPFSIFQDSDSPYNDYYSKILNTTCFRNSSIIYSKNKMSRWNCSSEDLLGNLMIVYYSGLFELFSKDNIVDSFISIFNVYCDNLIKGRDGNIFRDIYGNSFLHYCAISFNCRDAINVIREHYVDKLNHLDDPLESIRNLNGHSVDDFLNTFHPI